MSLSVHTVQDQISTPASVFDLSQTLIGNKYEDHTVNLVENVAIDNLEYQKTLSTDRAEEYGKGSASLITDYSQNSLQKKL